MSLELSVLSSTLQSASALCPFPVSHFSNGNASKLVQSRTVKKFEQLVRNSMNDVAIRRTRESHRNVPIRASEWLEMGE